MTLPRHPRILLLHWNLFPSWYMVTLGYSTIGLGHAVNVHWLKVKLHHLLKQVRCWRACCNCDPNWIDQSLRTLIIAQQSVDCGSCIIVSDAFFLQQPPDLRVIDLAETVVSSPNCGHRPREGPACKRVRTRFP